jgi:spermidine synthase
MRLWKYYFIVFMASACILVLELVAGRMMAPIVGVSLYTWTSIIGVVLAGISLGAYLGGRIADRAPYPQTLGILFLLSGLSTLSTLALIGAVGTRMDVQIPLMAKISLLTLILFFLPAVLFGTISPVVVKLALKSLETTGSTIGKIYAWSTVGSIVGTFATGFVLVSWFGTRAIVAGVAVTAILMGVIFGELWKRERAVAISLVLIFVGFGYFLDTRNALASPYWKESNYFSIRFTDRVHDHEAEPRHVRAMVLDHLVHSFVDMDDPTYLEYGYEKVYADIIEYLSQSRPDMNVLFIGGGGYTFPRYMEHIYPTSNLEVIEIDPEVTRAAYEELALSRDTRIVTYNIDGRIFFNNGRDIQGKYDIILGDAFNDLGVPYHLTTKEFHEKLMDSLNPGGFYLANIIDNPSRGDFLRPYVNTMRAVFPHVTVAAIGQGWRSPAQNTLIVVASREGLDAETFDAKMTELRGEAVSTKIMPEEELTEYLANGTDLVLTDDYAPVDQLMARLFDERGY